jgi:ABC-type sulfate transport system permease component
VVIVGGNFQGRDETLASALLEQFNYTANEPYATAIALVLLALIVVLVGALTVIQQRSSGIRLRFRVQA